MKIARQMMRVEVLPVYTCGVCGTEHVGTDTVIVDGLTLTDVLRQVERMVPPAYGIPVGWSCWGSGRDVTCPVCKKGELPWLS